MSDFWPDYLSQDISSAQQTKAQYSVSPIINRQVLAVKGPDSAKFMQGQFTCNVATLNEESFTHGACCNAKGRMVANFTLVKQNDDFLLALDSSLADALQDHLKKYRVFFKCTFELSKYVMLGVKGPDAQKYLTEIFGGCPTDAFNQYAFEGGVIIQLPFEAGYELWISPEQASIKIPELVHNGSLNDAHAWPLNLIEHGLPQLTLANLEKHIPQMINLGVTGGVSFNKGCYTGQEIVARMQYLGKMKRHMYLLSIGNHDVVAGDDVYVENGTSPVGTIINSHNNGKALAVIEDKHLQSPLFIGSNLSIAAKLLSLPYDPKYAEENAGS